MRMLTEGIVMRGPFLQSCRSARLPLSVLVCSLFLSTGCATALERESRCLASLTPDFIRAQDELRARKAAWVQAMYGPTEDQRQRMAVQGQPAEEQSTSRLTFHSGVGLTERISTPPPEATGERSQEAYRRLLQARRDHKATLDWYGRIYNRVHKRTEEERILSEARMVLFPTAGILLYPLVRWNTRAVIWDGEDPDAESDPIAHYCMERLAMMQRTAEAQ